MKTKILHFLAIFCLMSFTTCITAQVIYVNEGAGGANNGSSWTDAYNDLSDALNAAVSGDQVWVAAGTYRPGGMSPDTNSIFTFVNNVSLYGGFDGTETDVSQRDPESNICLLSGDLNEDDIAGDFTQNRTDNVKHVFFFPDSVNGEAFTNGVIDGFFVSGGYAYNSPLGGNSRRGGAILTYGVLTIRNCVFEDNFGHFGGAVYPRAASASGTRIENCRFRDNEGGSGGGAMYMAGLDTLIIMNTTFERNFAGLTDDRGGAIYCLTSSMLVQNCEFTSNVATSSAGAIYITDGTDVPINVTISNTNFTSNEGTFGGALTSYGDSAKVKVTTCNFTRNRAFRSGGAMTSGFNAQVVAENCIYDSNTAENEQGDSGFGGAVHAQNDLTSYTASNCVFKNNTSISGGGGFYTGSNGPASFTNCSFETNTSNTGGGLSYNADSAEVSNLNVIDCIFMANIAQVQGGGVNLGNATASIVNTLFDTNIANNTGTGGAISNNASANQNSPMSILNCTFANNFGVLSSGIAQWTDTVNATATMTIQNSILQNDDGINYAIEAGSPTALSNGGNLSADNTMMGFLTNTNDLNDMDPMFVDLYNSDLALSMNSPCIDKGIAAGAPPFDLLGNPRVGDPDMGAYEFQGTTSTIELVDNSALTFSPNPVIDATQMRLNNTWRGPLQIRIYDSSGKVVGVRIVEKNAQDLNYNLNLGELSSGAYRVVVIGGKEMMSKTVVKVN